MKNKGVKDVRRTISFENANNCYIQQYRGISLRQNNREITYTEVVNELLREAIQLRINDNSPTSKNKRMEP